MEKCEVILLSRKEAEDIINKYVEKDCYIDCSGDYAQIWFTKGNDRPDIDLEEVFEEEFNRKVSVFHDVYGEQMLPCDIGVIFLE